MNRFELKANERHSIPIDHELEFVLESCGDEDCNVKYILNNEEKKTSLLMAHHTIRTTYEASGELTILNEGPGTLSLGIE